MLKVRFESNLYGLVSLSSTNFCKLNLLTNLFSFFEGHMRRGFLTEIKLRTLFYIVPLNEKALISQLFKLLT